MPSIRAFVAIEMDAAIRRAIAALQDELRTATEKIRWTKPGNIHLTLKFLGDVDAQRVDRVAERLQRAVAQREPFSFSVKGLGVFPTAKRPRVLWAGVHTDADDLRGLAAAIEEHLQPLGFAKEKRAFKPHLTLARVREPLRPQFVERFLATPFNAVTQHVEEIVLMQSELHPQGARYTPLAKYRLQ